MKNIEQEVEKLLSKAKHSISFFKERYHQDPGFLIIGTATYAAIVSNHQQGFYDTTNFEGISLILDPYGDTDRSDPIFTNPGISYSCLRLGRNIEDLNIINA